MPRRQRSDAISNATKLAQLGLAAPHVVAHRMTRMALAGPVPSARDTNEFAGMLREKQLAFMQSWIAMFGSTLRAQQAWMNAWARQWPSAAVWTPRLIGERSVRLQQSIQRVAGAGLSPIHRKAVANSKRLARTRLR